MTTEARGARVAVSLLAPYETPTPSLRAALDREVLSLHDLPRNAADIGAVHDSDVVVVWLLPDAQPSSLESIVAWNKKQPRPAALIGVAQGGGLADRERGLGLGFDDFVTGDIISARELAGRVRALARRVVTLGTSPPGTLRCCGLVIDTEQHELWFNGARIAVTRTELAVLTALVRAQGRTLSRGAILDAAWGQQELEVGPRAVDNVILRLRRKLSDASIIRTVRGVGFRLREN